MNKQQEWREFIFDTSIPFENRCLKLFRHNSENNPVYNRFIQAFGLKSGTDLSVSKIPLLPIKAFKDARVLIEGANPEITFTSSGTSSMHKSRHFMPDPYLYKKSIETEFYKHFPKDEYSILCYTPGYSENPDSSLIWMLKTLVEGDTSGLSSFLPLNKPLTLSDTKPIYENNRNIILFGAAFGLMDMIENGSVSLPEGSHIIETGGMKTHRREMTRTALRNALSEGFQVDNNHIHSEYGMCELTSQMYAIGSNQFTVPDWVRVTIRNPENPFERCETGAEGKIGIIDLANVYSCPFILTDDRGVMDESGRFQVLGRWSNADPRGCNFLIDSET